ncbi:MAG: type II toxin-antitoxin system ParD family antitoxin [Planctomycetota bacterium]
MNIHLTKELERLVQERVSSGRYASASEVVCAALRLLEEDERWRDEVRQKIAEGVASAKAGQLLDGDVVFDEIEKSLRERGQKNSPE